jgi:hypothetical protein
MHVVLQLIVPLMPKPAKLICLATIPKGLKLGYPKLGHHMRSKAFPFTINIRERIFGIS